MEHEFWQERWDQGRIGFHQERVNPHLERSAHLLAPNGTSRRVLVPLCGKSHDLTYLAERGHEVVGVELVQRAVQDYFAERGVAAARQTHAVGELYRGPDVAIWRADFFDLDTQHVGTFNAAFDRAALIALPHAVRSRYVAHLAALLAPGARTLLVTLEHDGPDDGPPFHVGREEVNALWSPFASVTLLEEHTAASKPARLAEMDVSLRECVWLLEGARE